MAYALNFALLVSCFLLFYNTNASPVEVKCPVYCDCDFFEGLKRGTCQNRKLVSVEVDMPPQVDILDLSFNQISRLKNTIFVELELLNLKLLNMSHNKISDIDIFAFEGLSDLKTLDMSHNMITYFLDPWFISLDQLQELYLKGNLLKSINFQPKINILNLQVLDISDSRIESLHPGIFEFVPNLEVLDISDNYLMHLKVDVIKPLTKLTILNAQNNNFHCKDHYLFQLRNYTSHNGITYDDSCKRKHNNKQEKFQRMMIEPAKPKRNSWIYDEEIENGENVKIIEVCNRTEHEFLKNDTLGNILRIPYLREVIELSPELFLLIILAFGITLGIILGCSCQMRHKYKQVSDEEEPLPLFMTAPNRRSLSTISSRVLQRQASAPSSFRSTRSIGGRKIVREDRNILLMNEHKLSDSTPVLSRKSIIVS